MPNLSSLAGNPSVQTALTPRLNKYIPQDPSNNIKQSIFLVLDDVLEVMYGGSAGGGKSSALLMAALQYVEEPNYHALILRRTFRDLMQADAILDRAKRWLTPFTKTKEVVWRPKKFQFEFPTGSTITFGYLKYDNDVYQYDGSAYAAILFDELVQFSKFQYTFMFGRLRRAKNSNVPLRMRSGTNPGGVGHIWVRDRFIYGSSPNRIFVPAKLADNAANLDIDAYRETLGELDEVTRKQREDGDWEISGDGKTFKREWFVNFLRERPLKANIRASCRYWDLAATAGGGDFMVGTKISLLNDNRWVVEDVKRGQWGPGVVEKIVYSTAEADGRDVRVRIEQEPGSAGKMVVARFIELLAGWNIDGGRASGDKETRWKPFAAQCEAGNVWICSDSWNSDWLDEICQVPNAIHDDQADSVAGAFSELIGCRPKDYKIFFVGGGR